MANYLRTSTGKMKFVINQDRDCVWPMTLALFTTAVFTQTEEKDPILWAINLNMQIDSEAVLLGSFESVDDAIKEINSMLATDEEFYAVSGFEEWMTSIGSLEDISDCLDDDEEFFDIN